MRRPVVELGASRQKAYLFLPSRSDHAIRIVPPAAADAFSGTAETDPTQRTEISVAVEILNRMLDLGRPKPARVA